MEVLSIWQKTYDYIKGKILTGEYKPGEQLQEERIAAELDVSRPPMREAFRSLEHDYLIVNRPRRGNYVTEVSVRHFVELYKARLVAETGAILLLEKEGICEIPGIETTLLASSELTDSTAKSLGEELQTIAKLNDFHLRMVEATQNGWLLRFYKSITLTVCRYTFIYRREIKNTVEDHRKICEAIQQGRWEQARELTRSHIEQYMQRPHIDLIQRLVGDDSS